MFAELHCVSNFTFLRGASHPEELVEQAHALGYQALAITDECNMSGVVRAHVTAKRLGLKLIIGNEFRIQDPDNPDHPIQLVLLAPNKNAYSQLCGLITLGRRRGEKGQYVLHTHDLERNLDDCLALWPPHQQHNINGQQGQHLQQCFPHRLWLAVELLYHDQDLVHYLHCYQLSSLLDIPMVASNNVHMHCRQRKPLQDVLTAIRLNTPVQHLGSQLQPNAEQHLRPVERLSKIYPKALLAESIKIANQCLFSLDDLRYDYPAELVPQGLSPSQYLRQLVYQGASKRWPKGTPDHVIKLIEKELALVAELKYEYYFLTVYDIVHFARKQKILCQGRGSAANSSVCYCLFITEVDPARSSLLFERFISKERNEPPDIDVDFEHERREEVIQYIYKKYGRDRAALTATVITYRARSAIRDVGKALGLDELLIDQLAKSLAWWDRSKDLKKRLEDNNLSQYAPMANHLYQLTQEILGFPRHLSQHVGGFLITQNPITSLVPVENTAMEGRTVIQWDKTDIEALNLLKVDVLALGMLTAIRKTLENINKYTPCPLTLSDIPAEDPNTYAMLCRGDSIGVFQVESRAQMSMLPRLKPQCYYDLVVQVAIVRPGPIQGGMVHPYLKRRSGEEAVTYPNADLETVLKRTLGVPIFQEQAIQLSMVAAGFSGGEADQLRRAMASWGKNGNLETFKQKLINGMLDRGYSLDFAERLYKQIQGFGGYGFPESHAASFALLVYISSWLKCHHPAAFYCGLLNSLPMGFYSPSQLIQDAKRHGVTVHPADTDTSAWDHQLEIPPTNSENVKPALRIGLRLIKGFNPQAAKRIVKARQQKPFTNIRDLKQRAKLNQIELDALISANALIRITQHRHQAHWQAQAIEPSRPLLYHENHAAPTYLNDNVRLKAPSEVQDLMADYQSTGLTLGRHPMAILREQGIYQRCKRAVDLPNLRHKQFVRIAGLVTGRQRPGTAKGTVFITLEDETGNSNIVVWKNVQDNYRTALLKGKLLIVKGIIERSESVIHVVAGHLENRSEDLNELTLKSRDFH